MVINIKYYLPLDSKVFYSVFSSDRHIVEHTEATCLVRLCMVTRGPDHSYSRLAFSSQHTVHYLKPNQGTELANFVLGK